jgi:hypothetical protein
MANAVANATAEHILKHKHGSSGYLVLAREAKHYQCLDEDNRPSCSVRRRSPEAVTRCKKGSRTGARTHAGDLIAVKIKHIGASARMLISRTEEQEATP